MGETYAPMMGRAHRFGCNCCRMDHDGTPRETRRRAVRNGRARERQEVRAMVRAARLDSDAYAR